MYLHIVYYRLARKYGFEIFTKEPFASFYKSRLQEKNEEYDKLLQRMNALEVRILKRNDFLVSSTFSSLIVIISCIILRPDSENFKA